MCIEDFNKFSCLNKKISVIFNNTSLNKAFELYCDFFCIKDQITFFNYKS